MGGVLAGRSPALLGLIEPKGRVSMMDFPSQKKKKKVRSGQLGQTTCDDDRNKQTNAMRLFIIDYFVVILCSC
jgi:hypothetical protein